MGEPVVKGWVFENGTLCRPTTGGQIMTSESYANFELEFDWKISDGGSGGLFYRTRFGDEMAHLSGIEYQLQDDNSDDREPWSASGAIFGVMAPRQASPNPTGEWNSSRIVANGNHLEHWLNDEKVVQVDLNSRVWEQAVANGRPANRQHYAKSNSGHIVLQDPGKNIWFRKMRIRKLP